MGIKIWQVWLHQGSELWLIGLGGWRRKTEVAFHAIDRLPMVWVDGGKGAILDNAFNSNVDMGGS